MEIPSGSELSIHWDLDPERVFLNHGSFGATPRFVREEQRRWQDLMEREPVRFFERIAPEALLESRRALAGMLNCDADDLALIDNATTGVNIILRSLQFNSGDEILVPDHAYQACRNAIDFVANRWDAKVVTCRIPFPVNGPEEVIEIIMEQVTERTVLAMIDTVTSPTGLLMPFEELTHRLEDRGVKVLLDAAHGIGMVDLDLKKLGASFVTTNCHKWLCSPKGAAVLHVRKDLQKDIHPLTISHGMTFPLGDTTRFRHEFDWTGTRDISAHCSLPATIVGIAQFVDGGWKGIMKHNRELAITGRRILCEELNIEPPCPELMIGSIATLKLADDFSDNTPLHEPDPLHEVLQDKYGIQIPVWYWPSPEGRYIRISAQLYNHEDQYRYLAECLRKETLGG